MRYTKISQRYWCRMKTESLHAGLQSPTFRISLLYLRSGCSKKSKNYANQSDFFVACRKKEFYICHRSLWSQLKQLGPPSYITTSGSGAENLKLKKCECGLDLLVIVSMKILSCSKYTITNFSMGDVHELYHHQISLHVSTIHSPLLESVKKFHILT